MKIDTRNKQESLVNAEADLTIDIHCVPLWPHMFPL